MGQHTPTPEDRRAYWREVKRRQRARDPERAREYDRQHHARRRAKRLASRDGDPPRYVRGSAAVRLLHRMTKDPVTGCWVAGHSTNNTGYSMVRSAGRGSPLLLGHRVMYEAFVGPIPEGLTLDHLCRQRRCVNPAHLEPVSLTENIRRGAMSRRAQKEAAATA